jgi:cytochrome c oxidase subunit 3
MSLGQLGMVLVLVSISVLFVAAGIAVLITNHQAGAAWRSPEGQGLPWGTLASTALLGVVSWQLQAALVSIRNNRFTSCLKSWLRGGAAALVFLVVQAINVRHLTALEGEHASRTLFLFCYDLLVGLHAAHVIGGFVPLALVYAKLKRRDYSSSRHDGLTFCVQYWHYLGVVWLLLLGILGWVQ